VAIRAARHEDIPAVLTVWEQARSTAASIPDDAAGVALLIEHDPVALLVAEHDGQVVGTLIAGWDGWRGDMYRLAVLPEHRRRGIALALVEAGHERLRARGARRVTALIGSDDEQATALWRAAGYALDEERARYVLDL
jgi:ribosomal protein S18 acetylase RimI-like enzyme